MSGRSTVSWALGILCVFAAGCSRPPEQSAVPPPPPQSATPPPNAAARPIPKEEARPRGPSKESAAEEILSTLRPGRIAYDPPRTMKVALPVRVQVRIGELTGDGARAAAALEQKLLAGFERPNLPSQPVRVSKTMKVLLTGAPEEFRIVLQSPEEQLMDSSEPTEWRWMVTPLKSGRRRLHLSAVAVVNVGGAEKVHEFSVYDTDVAVKVNYSYLLSEHWTQIASFVSATGLGGWLAALFHRKRKQRSGRKAKAAGRTA